MLIHRDMGMGYMRIPITDHEMPEEHEVDMLVAFYHSAPSAVWWHFHCAAGRGRTTTAMVIIDMLRNRHRHPHLTLQDFLRRQHLIGGLDLENVSSDPAKAWKRQDSVNRKILLGYVFEYSRDDKAHESGMMFFSTWLKFRGFTLPSHPENWFAELNFFVLNVIFVVSVAYFLFSLVIYVNCKFNVFRRLWCDLVLFIVGLNCSLAEVLLQ